MLLKRWKHKGNPLRIPVQHEPGRQKGFGQSGKGGGVNRSEHQSRMHKSVLFYSNDPESKRYSALGALVKEKK